jgi:FKBP-type peptidyl-prolyl cis-trans isomerase
LFLSLFLSQMPRGQPLRFKIGSGDVIKGFEQGTKGMKVGGTRTVVIPAQLGYGARGAPPDIPGGATLVFDLELVSVK